MSYITSCLKIRKIRPFKARNWLVATMALSGILGFPGIASSASTAASLAAVNSLLLLTEPGPDLVVINPGVNDSELAPGDSFTISATVKNQGSEDAGEGSTLRYYSSTNSSINTGDTPFPGTDSVIALTAGDERGYDLAANAPNIAGVYWVGACVDAIDGETNINNQCSTGVPINVPVGKYCGQADLIVEAPTGDQPGVRKLQIEIFADASVLVTGEDNNVPGAISGTPVTTVTATIPIDITDPLTCVGTLNMTGVVALPNISGSVPGSVLCSGVLTIPITGTFSVTKSTEDCDLTPAP